MSKKKKLYKVTHTTDQHVRTQLVVSTRKRKARDLSITHNGDGQVKVEKVPMKKGIIKAFDPQVKLVDN